MTTQGEHIKNVIKDMDETYVDYKEQNMILERECGYKDGKLLDGRKELEFNTRKDRIWESYSRKCEDLRKRLKEAAAFAQNHDERFHEIDGAETPSGNGLFLPKYMPKEILVGKGRVQCPGLDEKIPLLSAFPLATSIYAIEPDRPLLVRMMMRLLLAVPLGKCEFYVYDPEHYGQSIGFFDQLLKTASVFPSKKVYVGGQLNELLDVLKENLAAMNQERFPSRRCRTWQEYNETVRERQESPQKLIPYKVLVLFGLPTSCENTSLLEIEKIMKVGEQSGILTMFTLNREALNPNERISQSTAEILQRMQESAVPVQTIGISDVPLKLLQMRKIFPKQSNVIDFRIQQKIDAYKKSLEEDSSGVASMDELLRDGSLFGSSSVDGLAVPVGINAFDGEIQYVNLGDETPHYLVGGATGSGKSNLVHDFIISACWHYSPQEVNFFLLDYKNGVEFSKYASSRDMVLPHAELVAKNADVGYGVTVLQHLVDVLEARNEKFKAVGKSDYTSFRKEHPNEIFPRLVLIVDEFQTLFQEAIDSERLQHIMQTLSKKGRSVGIHLIFATQTLKALSDFGAIGTQFVGRIALKCSIDDSSTILSYSNDEAAELVRPYAILNTQSGIRDYNQKFAVPLVEDGRIERVINQLAKACGEKGIKCAEQNVFDGAKRPIFPKSFTPQGISFHFGKRADYKEDDFWLELENSEGNNLLIMGDRAHFLECIIQCGESCEEIDCIDYIGEKLEEMSSAWNKFDNSPNFPEYFKKVEEVFPKKRRIIIVDGVSFSKTLSQGERNEKAEWEKKASMIPDLYSYGSHVIAFFSTVKEFKRRWPDREMRGIFGHVVGFDIAPQEWQSLTEDSRISGKLSKLGRTSSRATYLHDELVVHFKPFIGENDE